MPVQKINFHVAQKKFHLGLLAQAKKFEDIDLGEKNKEIEAIKKEKLGLNKEVKAQILPT